MRTEHEMELAIFTLEAGNRELKAERDALAVRVQEMREVLKNVRDTSSSTRLVKLADKALTNPDEPGKDQ